MRLRPCMVFRRKRIKLSREVVHNLKKVSRLSYINQWEYAGKINYKGFKFSDPIYVTSKKRNTVESKDISDVWYSEIGFHTHTGLGVTNESITENTAIYTTLPSNADFEAYIKGFPSMQCNIICDAHGYYIIDMIKSADLKVLPLPEAVYEYMRKLRSTPFMRICVFSDDTVEYFQTTIKNWKRIINEEVHSEMMELFGISIQYYRYDEEPPDVVIYQDIYVA